MLYLSFFFSPSCTLAPFFSDGFFLSRPVSRHIEPWTTVPFCPVSVLLTWPERSVERRASSPLLQTKFRSQAKLTVPLVQQLLFFSITLLVASIDPKAVENLLK